MPPVKRTPEEVRKEYVDLAFDEAYKIREELYGSEEAGTSGVYGRRKANREELRNLAAQGFLSEEQREELSELYPPRERKQDDDDDAKQDDDANDNSPAA